MPATVAGIGGAMVRPVECGRVTAIVSDIDARPAKDDVAAVRAHDAALRAVAASELTISAVRFGRIFQSDQEAVATLAPQSSGLAERLKQLEGCVEMRLLLPMDAVPVPPKAATTPGGPGRAYLEGLRYSVRVTGIALRETLGTVVLDERVEALTDSAGMAFAHLVRSGDVSAYRSAVDAIPALKKGVVVGPLPLYSFAPVADG